MGALLWVQVPP